MSTNATLPALPAPVFIDTDPTNVITGLIAAFEDAAGITLQPAQVERLTLNIIQYESLLIRNGIQFSAMQCLVRFAAAPMLDYLGELVDCERLGAQPATTTMQYTLSAAQPTDTLIPSGNRVQSKDGKVIFATSADLTIAAGQTSGSVGATAQTDGVIGNGYLAGDVNVMLDPVASVASASNTTETADGFDAELDDPYRARIMAAPESFSTAGAKGAYKFFAKSAHQSITDVFVEVDANGVVKVYVLTATGAADQSILDLVTAKLDPETVVPCSDTRQVLAPPSVDFALVYNLTLYQSADQDLVVQTVTANAKAFTDSLRSQHGADIVDSQLSAQAQIAGVYQVDLDGLATQAVDAPSYANCTGITVNVVGTTSG